MDADEWVGEEAFGMIMGTALEVVVDLSTGFHLLSDNLPTDSGALDELLDLRPELSSPSVSFSVVVEFTLSSLTSLLGNSVYRYCIHIRYSI